MDIDARSAFEALNWLVEEGWVWRSGAQVALTVEGLRLVQDAIDRELEDLEALFQDRGADEPRLATAVLMSVAANDPQVVA